MVFSCENSLKNLYYRNGNFAHIWISSSVRDNQSFNIEKLSSLRKLFELLRQVPFILLYITLQVTLHHSSPDTGHSPLNKGRSFSTLTHNNIIFGKANL